MLLATVKLDNDVPNATLAISWPFLAQAKSNEPPPVPVFAGTPSPPPDDITYS